MVCLACGGPAAPGSRRRMKADDSEAVARLWKDIIKGELDRRGQEQGLDLDCLLNRESFMCRKCHYAYEKVLNATKALASKMQAAVPAILAQVATSAATQAQHLPQQPLHHSTPAKRKRPSLDVGSPPAKRHIATLEDSRGHAISTPTTSTAGTSTAGIPATSTAATSTPATESDSPNVSISVEYTHSTRKYALTPSRKHVGKAIARRSRSALVVEALKDPVTRGYVVRRVGMMVRNELVLMCSDRVQSMLRSQSLKEFTWSAFMRELSTNAPVLLTLLKSCTHTRIPRQNRDAVIGVCCAILLKFRYSKMSLFHKIVSVILYAGSSGKQVYERLHKVGMCMSYVTTNRLITSIGEGHDNLVKSWKDQLVSHLENLHKSGEETVSMPMECRRSMDNGSDESSHFSSDSSSSTASSPIHGPGFSPLSSDATFSGSDCIDPAESLCEPLETSECEVEQSTGILNQDSSGACLPREVQPTLLGYKLVGDNIDKGVKARYMRDTQHRGQSLHYFHTFAVQSRIDFSNYPDVLPATCLDSCEHRAKHLLPSKEDDAALRSNLAILVSRILVDNMSFFRHTFDGVVTWHIKHQYYSEMSTESVVVPLGVLLKNENKGDEMVEIMSHLHQYVPSVEFGKAVQIQGSGETLEVRQALMRSILFGGDQLTAARARGAKRARANSLSAVTRLEGIEPTAADFHVRLNLLDIAWKYFYSAKSAGEAGTLFHIRNTIGRSNVSVDPIRKFNECDDFFKLVITCHVLVAAMKSLHMKTLQDTPILPVSNVPACDLWMETKERREEVLVAVAGDVVDQFIGFEFNQKPSCSSDKVFEYSKKLLGFGTFYLEQCDAIREGDGLRVLRCWKYLLPIFKSSDRRNYLVEVLNMLCQYHYEFTPRQAQELIWSRFVSTHSAPGRNVSEDLHQEHLNRVVKGCIAGLGANKTEAAVTKVGKALGTLHPILDTFDRDNSVQQPSGAHNTPSWVKDRDLIVGRLLQFDTFSEKQDRFHASFKNPKDFLHSLKHDTLVKWIITHL